MRIILHIFFFCMLVTSAFANDLPISGTSQQPIPLTHEDKAHPEGVKDIRLLEYELTSDAQERVYQQITRKLEQQDVPLPIPKNDLPKKVQLGMANVPVLDQGIHGSCTVFAVTAALDAALKRGDYISQLCLLQLGNHFENQGQGTSGWDGINLWTVADRITQYGVINIANQHRYGCAGVKLYPSYFFASTQSMSPEEYEQHHEQPIGQAIKWRFLYKNKRFGKSDTDPALVEKIKKALHAGSRVVIGTLLSGAGIFTIGTKGTHHYLGDTWVLTHSIAQDLLHSNKIAGHAMVITGYDDEATARDYSGHIHRGLFTLRNSWSSLAGDWGNYYMSYDYAEVLIHQGLQIDKK